MRKLQENPNARLRSVQGMMTETNLSRYHVMQIAEQAGAIVRFGKHGVRIEKEIFFAHLKNEANAHGRVSACTQKEGKQCHE